MKTGIITFDLKGNHYLKTFEGRWLIPSETIDAAWNAMQQMPEYETVQDEMIAGKLARGIVKTDPLLGDVIVSISYLTGSKEWPDRSVYGPQGGVVQ